MIRLTNVEKTYDNGTHALNGISFEIQDGEFVFLRSEEHTSELQSR